MSPLLYHFDNGQIYCGLGLLLLLYITLLTIASFRRTRTLLLITEVVKNLNDGLVLFKKKAYSIYKLGSYRLLHGRR